MGEGLQRAFAAARATRGDGPAERPLVLTAEEVRAALDGRLTQIARLCFATAADGGRITYGPGWPRGRGIAAWEGTRDDYGWPVAERLKGGKAVRVPGPFGAVGDLFYACEPFWQAASLPSGTPGGGETPLSERWGDLYHYAADGDPPNAHNRHYGPGGLCNGAFAAPDPYAMWHRRAAKFLPRKCARVVLRQTSTPWCDDLRSITEDGARAEGLPEHMAGCGHAISCSTCGGCEDWRGRYAARWNDSAKPGARWGDRVLVWRATVARVEVANG
jgi:hypothetical protein